MSLAGTHRPPGLAALAASLAMSPLLGDAQEQHSPDELEQLIQHASPEEFAPASPLFFPMRQERDLVTGGVETRHFRILGEYASLGVPVEDLGALFDEAFEYVRDRVGLLTDPSTASETTRLIVWIRPPSSSGSAMSCPQRGAAGGDEIVIYADGTTSQTQLVGTLAHEVGHVLMPRVLGGLYLMGGREMMMNEGYATWAAGHYVLDWLGIESLGTAVAEQLADGTYDTVLVNLGDHYVPFGEAVAADISDAECFARRDRAYVRWGGFIEYLVEREGPEALVALLRSGRRMPSGNEVPAELQEALAEARAQALAERGVHIAEARESPASVESPSMTPTQPNLLRYEEIYGLNIAELEGAWLESLQNAGTD